MFCLTSRRPIHEVVRATVRGLPLCRTRSKSSSARAPDQISTSLWYLHSLERYQTEKPYHINLPASALPEEAQSNEESVECRDITITNLRGREHEFSLDGNGFQVFGSDGEASSDGGKMLHSSLSYENYHSTKTIREKYYPAVAAFLRDTLGAETVVPFTHDVRRREVEFPRLPRGIGSAPQPVQGVHVDMTPRWAEERIRMIMPELARSVVKKRWQVLNVWRPLFGPLQDWPLALCDYGSIDPHADLIASDNIYTHLVTETYNVFHRPYHRWYYLRDMNPDEVLVFKTYDSKADGSNARVCPHAAFEDPTTPPGARLRESIECLVFVVYPEVLSPEEDQVSITPNLTCSFLSDT
ncbi:hypothetical protein CONLIGDRAFT_695192 [Coniochaeta ligniaria NRRL 30616]|uniref:Methyltransferase n=1 Tax=Coniochaeta ligniaria NRRL 30616 TaxID=1408157 RepID=A0A1J7JYL3_9PEZI|nr:hypothetical protein CONLIGDRAFT_695192 [Coniochaeta ligniaria NRRL 30616]